MSINVTGDRSVRSEDFRVRRNAMESDLNDIKKQLERVEVLNESVR